MSKNFIRAIIVMMFVLTLWDGGLQAAQEDLLKSFKEYLLSKAVSCSLQERSYPSADIRAIARKNLSSALLEKVLKITGTDFQFVLSGQQIKQNGEPIKSQIGILVFRYKDKKAAHSMQAKLAARRGYFKNTKMLIRFSSMPIGSRFMVIFTENPGDDAIVELMDDFREFLSKNYTKQNR